MKGFWDGSNKKDGTSGGGIVIEGVDKGNWIAISTVVVPLDTCSAMTAEVAGACILTNVLNLMFTKQLSVEKIDLCIDHIIKRQSVQWMVGQRV